MADTPESRLAVEVDPTAKTWTGVLELAIELTPSWPAAFSPQQSSAPVASSAQVKAYPAVMDDTPESRLELEVDPTAKTWTGVVEFVVELMPS